MQIRRQYHVDGTDSDLHRIIAFVEELECMYVCITKSVCASVCAFVSVCICVCVKLLYVWHE